MTWCSYLLAAVGLTIVLTMGRIAAPFRILGSALYQRIFPDSRSPLYCSMCSGMWVGWLVGICASTLRDVPWQQAVLLGPACSVVSYTLSVWLKNHGEHLLPEYEK